MQRSNTARETGSILASRALISTQTFKGVNRCHANLRKNIFLKLLKDVNRNMLKVSTEGKEQPLDSKNPKFIYYGNSVIYPFFNNTQ